MEKSTIEFKQHVGHYAVFNKFINVKTLVYELISLYL
jgi:hypothetical protein